MQHNTEKTCNIICPYRLNEQSKLSRRKTHGGLMAEDWLPVRPQRTRLAVFIKLSLEANCRARKTTSNGVKRRGRTLESLGLLSRYFGRAGGDVSPKL